MIKTVYIVWSVLAIFLYIRDYYMIFLLYRMANICNNGLICYWAGTAAFRKKYRPFLSIFRFNLMHYDSI